MPKPTSHMLPLGKAYERQTPAQRHVQYRSGKQELNAKHVIENTQVNAVTGLRLAYHQQSLAGPVMFKQQPVPSQKLSTDFQRYEERKRDSAKLYKPVKKVLGQNSVHYVLADQNSTKSRQTRRVSTHRPLSRPTPQTLMLTMGCECRTVRSMGSIRFSMSFSSIRFSLFGVKRTIKESTYPIPFPS
ncbi:hypothetical protein Nmel_007223, partial [Mimus melanotis]